MENIQKQAKTLKEIDVAVRFDMPVAPGDVYFVDFKDVRGDFEEHFVYRALNVCTTDYSYDQAINRFNKTLLFLGGMRGSGKTSEIAKYVKKLNHPNCFYCVVCNIDKELDTNDIEYMDILILQLEKLFEKANSDKLKLKDDILKSLQDWFGQRVAEVNKMITIDGGLCIDVEAGTPGFLSLFKIAGKLKAGITGTRETATKIRTSFKNNFNDFAQRFNLFIEEVNLKLRARHLAKEILFVVDGIEKTMSPAMRRKVIIEEENRLRSIKANTLFTLPIELMSEIQRLKMYATVVSFPFVKICEKDGSLLETAIDRFKEMVYKRITPDLFDSDETVRTAVRFSGGSPRELLRILEYANMYADETVGKITLADLNKALQKLAAECSQFVTTKDLEMLKRLKDNNAKSIQTPFDQEWLRLFEHQIVFEYNDGTYKRVNPVLEISGLYKQHVG